VSSVPRLSPAAGLRLALPRWPGVGRRAWIRALAGLALAVLVVLAALAIDRGGGPAVPHPAAIPARATSPAAAAGGAPRPPAEPPTAGRVVTPASATALFAPHSWYVPPPPRPVAKPPPPPPPPEPTAPPFPYKFLGSLSPESGPPVFFLSQGDRVIDAHVGDRLAGVYQFESAAGGQLVFVYLPLNVRQTLASNVPTR
jgi:hypothetical protein